MQLSKPTLDAPAYENPRGEKEGQEPLTLKIALSLKIQEQQSVHEEVAKQEQRKVWQDSNAIACFLPFKPLRDLNKPDHPFFLRLAELDGLPSDFQVPATKAIRSFDQSESLAIAHEQGLDI